jgi:hypothetical protein
MVTLLFDSLTDSKDARLITAKAVPAVPLALQPLQASQTSAEKDPRQQSRYMFDTKTLPNDRKDRSGNR